MIKLSVAYTNRFFIDFPRYFCFSWLIKKNDQADQATCQLKWQIRNLILKTQTFNIFVTIKK